MTTLVAPVRRSHAVMGSVASVHVHDDASETSVGTVIDHVLTELERLESVFSTFRPDSEISRINRGEMHHLDASREVIDVLDACVFMESISSGAFSCRRTDGSLDPAGFVKGWAVERAARLLDEAGLRQWCLSLGGDMQMGDAPDVHEDEPRGWKIGIADPSDRGRVVSGLLVQRGAVATSGTAERGRHIIDPRNGEPAEHWASFTVCGPSLTWADAFATTAFVMGEPGVEWVHRFAGYTALAVRADGSVVTV
jgi:thiamine biosynthesis lipoprotein